MRRAALGAGIAGLVLASVGCPGPPIPRSAPAPASASPPSTPSATVAPQDLDPLDVAQRFRLRGPVPALPDGSVVVEAEELHVATPGWRALPYGTNYYAATLANTFLSRQAYLGAPERGPTTEASVEIQVPRAGRYLALARYEAAYRFETRFRLRIEQDGQPRLDRLYGARDNLKVWAFGKGLARDIAWEWGAADALVWEGTDAYVDLQPGVARLTLVAEDQPEPAARRNVDVIVLTTDEADVKERLAKEPYLPFDGMLTQADDVFLRVHNRGGPFALAIPHGTEHSPYWVHLRRWKPKTLEIAAGEATDWIEVGSLLDTLSDGQWDLSATGKGGISFDADVGVRRDDGAVEPVRTFADQTGDMHLAYFGNTRYGRRIRTQPEVLDALLEYLRSRPVTGDGPSRTPVYGSTFERSPSDEAYDAKLDEFLRLMGTNRLSTSTSTSKGLLYAHGLSPDKVPDFCRDIRSKLDPASVDVVSIGDEIALDEPPANPHAAFRAWLRERHVAPSDLDPSAGGRYDKIVYDPSEIASKAKPGLFYYSKLFAFHSGIQAVQKLSAAFHGCFPNAGIGANFSPHVGHLYLGSTYQWITAFREGALTMPWSEDYIFQVPVGSPQVNSLVLDIFRAGMRGRPGDRIQYYVMAHDPGNTPNAWRRQFYGDLGHGAKVLNLFELRPLQVAYTENHVDAPEMYQAVRVGLHELARFDDIVQDGQVRKGVAALWFSEVADVWDDKRAPFDAAERSLYLMLRHQQLPLDVVVEGDDLDGYSALFLTDRHVSRAASRAIAAWVERGGQLVATAGAGMLDEMDRPNATLRRLFGVAPGPIERDGGEPVRFEKQDLPFVQAMDQVRTTDGKVIPVIDVRAPVTSERADVSVVARFEDGRAAMTARRVGKGVARYVGFLPGLSYLKPAFPRRPFDRRSDDGAMCHLLPTVLDDSAFDTMRVEAARPVEASERLVESTVIESPHGMVITLVNWSGRRVADLKVVVRLPLPPRVSLASGGAVRTEVHDGETTFTLDLDVADAIVLR